MVEKNYLKFNRPLLQFEKVNRHLSDLASYNKFSSKILQIPVLGSFGRILLRWCPRRKKQ